MKILLILALCVLAIWGGYEAAKLYDRNPAPSQGLQATRPETRSDERALNRQARLDRLKAELARQAKLVSDLDAKLNGLDVSKGANEDARLRADIETEKGVIAGLEARVRDERAGLASGSKGVLGLRRDGLQKKRAALADTQAQLRATQEDLRVVREQLRNRVALGWTMDQVNEANNRIQADQTNLTALNASLQQIRATDYSSPQQQAVSNQALTELRSALGQEEASLASERKKLRDLEDQAKRDDKSTNDSFNQRDRLQNQFQTERQKLDALKSQLDALNRE